MDAFDSIAGSLDRASALGSSAGAGLRGDMPPPPPGSGGKFNFAPNEIRAIVKDWLELAHEYEESLKGSARLVQVQGPGAEDASERHAMTASASGSAYVESVELKRAYCIEQAAKFQDALDRYLGTEEASKIRLRLQQDQLPIGDSSGGRATTGGI